MRVYLRTFGCRANHYDTEVVRAMLVAAGGEMVDTPADADVAIFNSCAVTADAEADLRQGVRRAARARPALRTLVMGCAAGLDRSAREIRALPSVSDVIGGADLEAIARALDLPADAVHFARGAQTGARAVLRIQDGCDEHCTFCATTLARGANRSRTVEELVAEAVRLAERHAEIVITGIHIGAYGSDIGTSLGALMERLVRSVPSTRFRLSSLEATEVDDRLLELFDEPRHLAPFLHAPLQSASDRVLKRMGRHWYAASSYARAVERIVRGRAVFGLGADVIAGFPGETAADHAETMALVSELPFTLLHVFPYSPRPGTAAERLGDGVAGGARASRARELRVLGEEKSRTYRASRVGGACDVVVVGGGDRRDGVTEDYLTVDVSELALPRGARVEARLAGDASRLIAVPERAIFQG